LFFVEVYLLKQHPLTEFVTVLELQASLWPMFFYRFLDCSVAERNIDALASSPCQFFCAMSDISSLASNSNPDDPSDSLRDDISMRGPSSGLISGVQLPYGADVIQHSSIQGQIYPWSSLPPLLMAFRQPPLLWKARPKCWKDGFRWKYRVCLTH
jgi:hypothetical protein